MRPILFVKNDPVETFGIAAKVFADQGADALVLDALDTAASWPAVDDVAGIMMFGGSVVDGGQAE